MHTQNILAKLINIKLHLKEYYQETRNRDIVFLDWNIKKKKCNGLEWLGMFQQVEAVTGSEVVVDGCWPGINGQDAAKSQPVGVLTRHLTHLTSYRSVDSLFLSFFCDRPQDSGDRLPSLLQFSCTFHWVHSLNCAVNSVLTLCRECYTDITDINGKITFSPCHSYRQQFKGRSSPKSNSFAVAVN